MNALDPQTGAIERGNTLQTVRPIPQAAGVAIWLLLTVYAASRFLQVYPGKVPMLVVVILHVVPAALFALVHGALIYRWRGILVFIGVCLLVGNFFENLGIRTGFPFGHYYFTGLMGPKISAVPIFLGLAYVGMAYVSWTLARIILGALRAPLAGRRVFTLPAIASFLMVAWDLAMDPVWSTILHAWIWRDGGAYFGVPISNFLGWYLTVYIIFQLFALYLRGRPAALNSSPPGYWRMPILFYGICAAGNVLLALPSHGLALVTDPSGAQWRIRDIVSGTVVVSIFLMAAFALLAWIRLIDQLPRSPES